MTLHLIPDTPLTAAAESRTIRGLILPWNKEGRTSRGKVSVDRGSVAWSGDLRRVKLLAGHRKEDGTATSVGFLQSIEDTDDGLVATFKVGSGDVAQRALDDAIEGVVDAMSVELDGLGFSPDGRRITSAVLSAVALVPIPAFSDARISEVTAQDVAEPLGATVMKESHMADEATLEAPAPEVAAAAKPDSLKAAAAPVGLSPITTRKRGLSLHEVCEKIQDGMRGTTSDLTAALVDITRTANPYVAPDGWVGELWSGVAFDRQIVPLLTQRELTSWKVTGWKWTDKPSVAPYTGDKAAIPSDTVATTSVSVEAQRLAGGHDIDRKFFDFNDQDFIESYFRAMAESYAQQSDLIAQNFVINNATGLVAPASSNMLKQVAYAANSVRTNTRTRPTFVLVNDMDFLSIGTSLTADQVPALLSLLGVDPAAFIPLSGVPAGTVIVGAKPAATFYELGGSPIRVQAEHLANGGRDAALFGYVATLLHNANGIVKAQNPVAKTITITGTPTGGTWTATINGTTTAAIAYNASAAAVKSAFEVITGANTVTATGGALPGTPVGVTFSSFVSSITVSGAGLTGGTSPAVVLS